MGKKRVAEQNKEELIKTSQAVEDNIAKKSGETAKRKYDSGKIFIQATYNNTLMTVTDEKGNVVAWMSAGTIGFSGPKKATPFAASKVAEAIAEKVQKSGPLNVDVLVKGIGSGRDSALRSLASRGFNIKSVRDVTPIPHNGPRPPKPRRV